MSDSVHHLPPTHSSTLPTEDDHIASMPPSSSMELRDDRFEHRQPAPDTKVVRAPSISGDTWVSPPRRSGTLDTLESQTGFTPSPTTRSRKKSMFLWLGMGILFIPISTALHFGLPQSLESRDIFIFIFSCLAMIPLTMLHEMAMDELCMRVGQTLAALLSATLGNTVELTVAIIALIHCDLRVVQVSLVGSALSNLLLVVGMCFFVGGIKYSEQQLDLSSMQTNSSLLTISVIAILLPAAFHFSVNITPTEERVDILSVSHGVAIILMFTYISFLFYQFLTCKRENINKQNTMSNKTDIADDETVAGDEPLQSSRQDGSSKERDVEEAPNLPNLPATGPYKTVLETKSDEGKMRKSTIPVIFVVLALIIVIALVALTAEWLVRSIDGLTASGKISKEFIGIILIPILGNADEHITAVSASAHNKLSLSLGVAVGSTIQISLFVIPFVVTLGWILGKPLTLLFDPFESIALFLSVITLSYVVQDGKSNWFEGLILISLYTIICVTFWYYPGSDLSGVLAQCK